MTRTTMSTVSLRARRSLAALAVVGLGASLSACDLTDQAAGDPAPAVASATAATVAFDSQFTRDGTFQSHIDVPGAKGMDFVYTLYPTKSTPRTNEWYPTGGKYFSFTFQAYDLDQDLRAPFTTKRKVWLSKITVTSATTTIDGGATQQPYVLDSPAPRITFDPQPLTSKYGMLVTSPKGAFELRNQEIGDVSADTIGVTLTMTATVSIETAAGSGKYHQQMVTQDVPIAVFASEESTQPQDIPVDAN